MIFAGVTRNFVNGLVSCSQEPSEKGEGLKKKYIAVHRNRKDSVSQHLIFFGIELRNAIRDYCVWI